MGSGCYSLCPAEWISPISKSGPKPGRAVPANKTRTTPLPVPLLGSHLRRWQVQKNKNMLPQIPFHTNTNNCLLLCCVFAEARGLVRALLQPDPTVRLTAEQTLLHPWVKAMASICRQRALTDKAQRNTADTEAEPDRVHTQAQSSAAETVTDKDKTPGHTRREGEITHREPSRQTEINTGREDEDEPLQQGSKETGTEDIPGQQRSECTSTDSGREKQDPGSLASDSVELNQLCDPSRQN